MDNPFNYLIVSDFHLSEGRNPVTGLIHPNEDFFQDIPFARFLSYHARLSQNASALDFFSKPWRLVMNGDIFDFLQVVSLPTAGDELAAVTGYQAYSELRTNVCKFGLGTEEKATLWKLDKIKQGHPLFFQALAWFVAQNENEIILLKGNHDIEVYWPAVQERLRQLLKEAYQEWHTAVSTGDVENPLPYHDWLPRSLTNDALKKRVRFSRRFLYQRDLFFIEHGCQYDPINAFQDFINPRLINEQGQILDVIDLPEGSLFVRYFFNKIEAIHPFADNWKPITRYFFWLITNAPNHLMTFFEVLLQYRSARSQIKRKKKKPVHYRRIIDGRLQPDSLLDSLQAVQAEVQVEMGKVSKTTTRRMLGSVLLLIAAILLALVTIRTIAVANFGLAFAAIFFMVLCIIGSTYYFQSLSRLLKESYLKSAAEKVAAKLNGRPLPTVGPVRYHIFGHDHAADIRILQVEPAAEEPGYRQWYVNTGSWIPVFSPETFTHPAANMTFMRLVPSRLKEGDDVPELLRWPQEGERPYPAGRHDPAATENCEEEKNSK